MPYRALKPCAHPCCRELTSERLCPAHKRDHARYYERYDRDLAVKERYDATWRSTSAAYRQAHPLCELCERAGKLTPVYLVHHKKPLSEGGGNDWGNLQALCLPCHDRLHAERGDYFGQNQPRG